MINIKEYQKEEKRLFKDKKSLEKLTVKELDNELSKIDQSISDTEHYIEFNSINKINSYTFKFLQNQLRYRRKIKQLLTSKRTEKSPYKAEFYNTKISIKLYSKVIQSVNKVKNYHDFTLFNNLLKNKK